MKDRIPTKPGRVAVYDDNGNFLRYERHVRADEPTQEGDPLNKENLLADLTCDVLNIPRTSVPDDAFLNLALGTYKYVYVVTAKTNTGRILSGITIKGIVNRFGQSAVTDSNGVVVGFSDSPSVTLTFTSNFIDLKSKTKRVTNTGVLTQVDFIVNAIVENTIQQITTSKAMRFSKPVIADIALIGGGAGGSVGWDTGIYNQHPGVGGGGGYVTNVLNKRVTNDIRVTVGAGGRGGCASSSSTYDGHAGGNTVAVIDGITYTAKGGQLPDGNGKGSGGDEGKGGDRYQFPFNNNCISCSGGGGTGGNLWDKSGTSGGASYGGRGGNVGQEGQDGQGYGGGGGGSGIEESDAAGEQDGGDGYQGVVMIRWRYA